MQIAEAIELSSMPGTAVTLLEVEWLSDSVRLRFLIRDRTAEPMVLMAGERTFPRHAAFSNMECFEGELWAGPVFDHPG